MGSSDPLAWRSGRACHSVRAVPATLFFAWFAVRLNSLSASAGERAGERCRSNEFALIREIRVKVFVLIMESSVTLAWRSGRACHSVRAVGLNPPAWVGNRGGQGTARPTRRCSKVNFNCYSVGPPACGRAGVSRPAENDSRQSSAPDAFGSALNRNLVVRINRQFRRISACPSNSSASVSSPRICSPSRQSSSRRYCLGNRQFARIPNHTTFC